MGEASGTKYKAKKTTVDGIQFDSKIESEYYEHLKELKNKGEIESFDLQPRFVLQDAFQKHGKKYQPINYVADFLVWYKDGSKQVIDVKGMETPDFKIKKKLFEKRYPELQLIVMKKVQKFGGWITSEEWKAMKKAENKAKKRKGK